MTSTKPPRGDMSRLKDLLRHHELRVNKRMGQHFLVDRGILKSIIAAADVTREDTVIEIGPGTGSLTSELQCSAGEVIAVELDRRMVALLHDSFDASANVQIVEGDILTLPPAELLDLYSIRRTGRYKVVANLPYYITSPVLRHFLHTAVRPDLMVVMVQEEVGRAIMAQPGDMSLLSVSVQAFAHPNIVRRVSAGSFHPPPKVDSLVLRLEVLKSPPVPTQLVSAFLDFVAAGFHSPRKQLRNSFGHGLPLPREQIDDLLTRGGIDRHRRPETLTVEEWVRLWHTYCATASGEEQC